MICRRWSITNTVEKEHDPSATGTLIRDRRARLSERITARRDSVEDRVAKAIEITPTDRPFVWWCNLNSESEMLAKAFRDAVETKGRQRRSKGAQDHRFLEGRIRVLVTKAGVPVRDELGNIAAILDLSV
jgi:hypothetical protein